MYMHISIVLYDHATVPDGNSPAGSVIWVGQIKGAMRIHHPIQYETNISHDISDFFKDIRFLEYQLSFPLRLIDNYP